MIETYLETCEKEAKHKLLKKCLMLQLRGKKVTNSRKFLRHEQEDSLLMMSVYALSRV